MKKLIAIAVALTVAAVFGVIQLNAQANSNPRDCDNNAIMYCGAYSASEFNKKLKADKHKDLKAIFKHYGVSTSDITKGNYKNGVVKKNGDVYVGKERVAKNAVSVGRQVIGNSSKTVKINGKKYYERATSASFRSPSIPAFVVMKDGKFHSAVIKSCGNPIRATPTPPKPPKPQPKPAAECKDLTSKQINRTTHEFTANATVTNGAKITGYTFNFGDGKLAKQTSNKAKHTYAKAGTYTVTVTVHTSVGDRTGNKCKTVVTVKPAPAADCKHLTATISDRNKFTLNAAAAVSNGATVNQYVFTVTDENGKTVFNETVKSNALTADVNGTLEAGTYNAKVVVKTSVGDKTSQRCEDQFTIAKKPVATCEGLTATIEKEDQYTLTAQASATNGAEIEGYNFVVTNEDGETVLNETTEANTISGTLEPGTYTAQVTVKTSLGDRTGEDCKANLTVEQPYCVTPEGEKFPEGSPECEPKPEAPETPEELPETGLGSGISAFLGLGSIAGAVSYYVASRRSLLETFLNR